MQYLIDKRRHNMKKKRKNRRRRQLRKEYLQKMRRRGVNASPKYNRGGASYRRNWASRKSWR